MSDDRRRPVPEQRRCAACHRPIQERHVWPDDTGLIIHLDQYPEPVGTTNVWIVRADLNTTFSDQPQVQGYKEHECHGTSV